MSTVAQTRSFISGWVLICLAFPAAGSAQDGDSKLNEHLQAFAPYVGTWICETQWQSGGELWAQNEYSIGMNGNFFEAITSSKNAQGGIYQRYKTTWLYDPNEKKLKTYGFTYDGTVTITEPEIDDSGEGHPIIRSKWQQPDGTWIKQEVQMNEDNQSYQWRVWSSQNEKDWDQIMDGTWDKRV